MLINNQLKRFYEVGAALKKIRDKRLYRETCDTFEAFCRMYLDISRIHVYRLIQASEVVENLLPIGNIPLNEGQTRPLTKLEKSEQKIAWKYAFDLASTEERRVTALDIKNGIKLLKTTELPNKIIAAPLVISPQLKKSYDNFFAEIKQAMNNNWQTVSCEGILKLLKGLIKFLKGQK